MLEFWEISGIRRCQEIFASEIRLLIVVRCCAMLRNDSCGGWCGVETSADPVCSKLNIDKLTWPENNGGCGCFFFVVGFCHPLGKSQSHLAVAVEAQDISEIDVPRLQQSHDVGLWHAFWPWAPQVF